MRTSSKRTKSTKLRYIAVPVQLSTCKNLVNNADEDGEHVGEGWKRSGERWLRQISKYERRWIRYGS